MNKFIQHTGLVVPLDIANVDTDAIIPKQFLQKVTRIGFGKHLFNDWRFLDNNGEQDNPEFVLNFPRYKDASILLVRENFGCGSSREHAPWALADYGFKVIIGSTFADIFYNNAFNNQLLLITQPEDVIDALFRYVENTPECQFTVNLEKCCIETGLGEFSFTLDAFKRHCLLNGLDNIGLTLQHEDKIRAYEQRIPEFLR